MPPGQTVTGAFMLLKNTGDEDRAVRDHVGALRAHAGNRARRAVPAAERSFKAPNALHACAAREACSRAGVYLASLGWGITRQSLGDAEMSRTKLLAGLYFACSLVLELVPCAPGGDMLQFNNFSCTFCTLIHNPNNDPEEYPSNVGSNQKKFEEIPIR